MKKSFLSIFVFIALLSFSKRTEAQYSSDVGGSLGTSLYLGDLGASTGLEVDFNQMRYHIGGSFRNFFSPNFAVKASLNYGQIRGTDKNSTDITHIHRNLSFKNDILELSGRGEWHFLTIDDVRKNHSDCVKFNLFAFVGFGVFYNNPKAEFNGRWVALQPLQTEGVSYSRIQPVVPIGFGFHFEIKKRHLIGWEFGARKTFTDYLDDVSTKYIHYSEFTDPTALALQDRSVEIVSTKGLGDPDYLGPEFYSYGTDKTETGIRGNPDNKDWYAFTGITYSYSFGGKKKSHDNSKYKFFRRKHEHVDSYAPRF